MIYVWATLLFASLFLGCTHSKYQGPTEYASLQVPITKFGELAAKKHGMRLLVVGKVSASQKVPYSLVFSCDKEVSLERGKILAATVVRDFLQMLQTVPGVKANRSSQPGVDSVGLKIGFWDKEVNRYKRPNLAEIIFRDGTFYYYEPDPRTAQLRLVYKESLEEALVALNV